MRSRLVNQKTIHLFVVVVSRKTADDSLTKGHSAGCLSLRDQKKTMANFVPSKSEMSRSTDSLNGLAFNAKYTDPGTDVIANVTSVEDLREKVTLSWDKRQSRLFKSRLIELYPLT